MSGITKACETCAGHGGWSTIGGTMADCADCGATGRVPDVEGQLRAEVARLKGIIDAMAANTVAMNMEVARLRDSATEDIARLADENARLTENVPRIHVV